MYERLFVNGRHVQNDGQLLPDPYRPPTSVNPALLRRATVHPSPEARTHVCVEMPGWPGQLVVTLNASTTFWPETKSCISCWPKDPDQDRAHIS